MLKEVASDPSILVALEGEADTEPDVMRTPAYKTHPLVIEAVADDRRLPIPLAVYLDGVAFTSHLGGRSDTTLGIWAIILVTHKRHLFATYFGTDRSPATGDGAG